MFSVLPPSLKSQPVILALAVAALIVAAHAGDPAELEQLRTNYKAALGRADRPIMQAYIAQLERQRDTFARAANLDAANAVQAEIKEIKQTLATLDASLTTPPKIAPPQPATAATSTGKSNLLANPSFEDGQNGWVFTSSNRHGTVAIDPTEIHDGKNSIRIDNSTDDDGFLRQTVAVKPFTRYRFTGHIKTKDVGPAKTPHSGATLCLDDSFEHTEAILGNKSWTKVSFEFETGNVSSVKVGPRLGQRATAGVAWFDDLLLVEVGPAHKHK